MDGDGPRTSGEKKSRIYVPKHAGSVLDLKGKPLSRSRAERIERERRMRAEVEAGMRVRCDYCRKARPRAICRRLPNGLVECKHCRPVKDVASGRMVRPDPEATP